MSQVFFSCYSHHPQEFFCLEGRNPFYLGKKAELGKFRIPSGFYHPWGGGALFLKYFKISNFYSYNFSSKTLI